MTSGSSFNQQWDVDSHHATASPSEESLSASHSILESLRKRRGLETAQWMNKLANEVSLDQRPSAVVSQQGLPAVGPEDMRQHELSRWLDKLFSQFDILASQFNRTAQGTDLVVACTAPSMTGQPEITETTKDTLTEKVYEGHLVTRYWAMLLRGTAGTINIYIIPAEVLLGFSLHRIDESIYNPLLVLESSWKENQLTWHIGGTCITREQISLLAKELFGDLVRVASGQMNESELFAHPLLEPCLGQNLAVGYKVPTPAIQQPAIQTFDSPKPALPPASEPKPVGLNLTSFSVAKQMLAAMELDIEQLFKLGQSALTSSDTPTFQKIKVLTEKMETLKTNFKSAFSEMAEIIQTPQEKK